jgi:phosphohistidine phosphatase
VEATIILYLVQHAEAKTEQEDPSRGLSENGLSDIKKIANQAARLSVEASQIFHSGKKRASQTAQILAEHLHPDKGVSESDGLAPMDEPKIWAERLSSIIEEKIMLVGHLPHLGRLAGLLICNDEKKNIVNFKMAGIVCLKRDEDMSWSLEWMLTPEEQL